MSKPNAHRNLTHSIKLTVSLTPDQYVRLRERAMFEECSMAWLVRTALSESMHSFAPKSARKQHSANAVEAKL
jgi:hypothetical protein